MNEQIDTQWLMPNVLMVKKRLNELDTTISASYYFPRYLIEQIRDDCYPRDSLG